MRRRADPDAGLPPTRLELLTLARRYLGVPHCEWVRRGRS
jgi:hypothetical protein